MKNSTNKKLIVLSVLVMLCIFAFYKVINYYGNKDIEPVVKDSVQLADVNLGDASNHCTNYSYFCNSGDINHWSDSHSCAKNMGSAVNGKCSNGYYLYMGKCYKVYTKNIKRCTSCESHYKLVDGKCELNCSVELKIANGRKWVSVDTPYVVDYNVINNCPSNTEFSISVTNGSSSSKSINKSSGWITVTAGKCGDSTVKFTNESLGISSSVSIKVRGSWIEVSGKCEDSPKARSAVEADRKEIDEYYTDPKTVNGKTCFTVLHTRACNPTSTSTPTKACYANSKSLSTATDAKWGEKTNSRRYLISWVTEEEKEKCKVTKEPKPCKPTAISCTSNNGSTSTCEDKHVLKYEDGESCDGNAFYKINCKNTVTSKFDYGDDGIETTANNLLVGQGFKYGITMTTVRECTAEFSKDTFTKYYNYVVTKISQAKNEMKKISSSSEKTKLESLIKELENKKKELVNIVEHYNEYTLGTKYNEAGTISLPYRVNKNPVVVNSNFVVTVIQEGSGEYTKKSTVDLGISGITNPSNYTWTNKNSPRKVKLNLPKVYIDKNGKIGANGIDGGNKLYIDYYTDVGTYTMNISLTGLGCNSKIENNKCSIKVTDKEISYRPIDVTNPFINSKWVPGTNWYSTGQFDFRSVIH